MHTLYRFAASLWAYLGVVFVFAFWGLLAVLAQAPEAAFVVVLFAAVFFAPMAFANKWDEIGD